MTSKLKINKNLNLMPHQVPPEGDWKVWEVSGERGSGKTFCGAYHAMQALEDGKRVLIVLRHGDATRLIAATLGIEHRHVERALGSAMCRAEIVDRGGIRGVRDIVRGHDYDLIWLDEPSDGTIKVEWALGTVLRTHGAKLIVTRSIPDGMVTTKGTTKDNFHLDPSLKTVMGVE